MSTAVAQQQLQRDGSMTSQQQLQRDASMTSQQLQRDGSMTSQQQLQRDVSMLSVTATDAALVAAPLAQDVLQGQELGQGKLLGGASQWLSLTQQEGKELQMIIRQILRSWGSLSRPVRVRVVWVVTHYSDLSDAVDEGWELLLKV